MELMASANFRIFPSMLCALVLLLFVAGCGQREETKVARSEPAQAAASPEATFQQCLNRAPAAGAFEERPPTDRAADVATPTDCEAGARDCGRSSPKGRGEGKRK